MTVFESKLMKELSRRFDCKCLFVSKISAKEIKQMMMSAVDIEWNDTQSRKYYMYTMPALHTDFRVLQKQSYEPACRCNYTTKPVGTVPELQKGVTVFVELLDDGRILYDLSAYYCVL